MTKKPLNRAPAYQTYANEALTRTIGFSVAAVGTIHRLELYMWSSSADQISLPDEPEFVARIVGVSPEEWVSLRAQIQHPSQPYFEEKDGRLVSPYLRQEAKKQRNFRKMQAEKGKLSAEKRAQPRLNSGSTAVQPRGNSSSASALSSSFPISTDVDKKEGEGDASEKTDKTPPTLKVVKNKTRLPEDLKFDETHASIAKQLGLNVFYEFGKFKDKAMSLGYEYLDWAAAFRIWLKKEAEFKKERAAR